MTEKQIEKLKVELKKEKFLIFEHRKHMECIKFCNGSPESFTINKEITLEENIENIKNIEEIIKSSLSVYRNGINILNKIKE